MGLERRRYERTQSHVSFSPISTESALRLRRYPIRPCTTQSIRSAIWTSRRIIPLVTPPHPRSTLPRDCEVTCFIIHGSGDDNVHYQGTEKLINRLVELGKPFDFMEYPNRTHSISEGAGTTLHVYSLIGRYFEEHLPAGPR